jgi:hypothetical protein
MDKMEGMNVLVDLPTMKFRYYLLFPSYHDVMVTPQRQKEKERKRKSAGFYVTFWPAWIFKKNRPRKFFGARQYLCNIRRVFVFAWYELL